LPDFSEIVRGKAVFNGISVMGLTPEFHKTYFWLKNFEDMFTRFYSVHERDRQTGRRTDTA